MAYDSCSSALTFALKCGRRVLQASTDANPHLIKLIGRLKQAEACCQDRFVVPCNLVLPSLQLMAIVAASEECTAAFRSLQAILSELVEQFKACDSVIHEAFQAVGKPGQSPTALWAPNQTRPISASNCLEGAIELARAATVASQPLVDGLQRIAHREQLWQQRIALAKSDPSSVQADMLSALRADVHALQARIFEIQQLDNETEPARKLRALTANWRFKAAPA